jgi:hypothetical protein
VAPNNKLSGQELFSNALTDNRDLLLEITADIIGEEKFSDSLEWVNKWLDLCQRLFYLEKRVNDNSCNEDGNAIENFYNKGLAMLSDFLGLNSETKELLNHLVASSLKDYCKKSY